MNRKQIAKGSWFAMHEIAGEDTTEITLYDVIDPYWGDSAARFIRLLNAVETGNITLRIHSPGGDVVEGWAIYNAFRRHKARVTTEIDGMAASMASVVALAGDEVRMAENAYLMIHNPWGLVLGESGDARQFADLLDKMRDNIVGVYASKTGLPEDELRAMMDAETWMDGPEAKEKGFVDSLTNTVRMAAVAGPAIGNFRRVPGSIAALAKGAGRAAQPKPHNGPDMTTEKKPNAQASPAEDAAQEKDIQARIDNAAATARAEGETEGAGKAAAEERKRVEGLTALARKHGLGMEGLAKAVADGTTVEAYTSAALDEVSTRAATKPLTDQPGDTGGQTEEEKLRAELADNPTPERRGAIAKRLNAIRRGE